MYCPRCGAKCAESAAYCASCGNKLPDINAANPQTGAPGATGAYPEPQAYAGAQPPKKPVNPVIVAAVTALVVIAAVVGLFASGILPPPDDSNGDGSQASSGSAASSSAASSDASQKSAAPEQADPTFHYVNLGTEDNYFTYPVISGGNEAVVQKLNARLEKETRAEYDKYLNANRDGSEQYYSTRRVTVTYLKDNTVGLFHEAYLITGGPHGYPECWAEVVNLDDGSVSDACDFVGLSQDERDRQTKQLVNDFYSATGEHDLFTSSTEVFEFHTPSELVDMKNIAYVLTTDGVYTYYGSYVLGSYAFGTRMLLMCDLKGAYVGYVDANPEASYPAENTDAADGEQTAENGQSAQNEQADYHIATDDFEFDLPEYWRGKVDYIVATNDEGMASVTVYPITALTANPSTASEYRLATIEAVSPDSPAARNMGDYISHVAAKVEGSNKTVVVHSTNWPAERVSFYFNNPNYAGSSQENELTSALVDLITGGTVSEDEARTAAARASSIADTTSLFASADIDFLESNLVPTITVR